MKTKKLIIPEEFNLTQNPFCVIASLEIEISNQAQKYLGFKNVKFLNPYIFGKKIIVINDKVYTEDNCPSERDREIFNNIHDHALFGHSEIHDKLSIDQEYQALNLMYEHAFKLITAISSLYTLFEDIEIPVNKEFEFIPTWIVKYMPSFNYSFESLTNV